MAEIRKIQPNLVPDSRYVIRVRAINPFNVPSDWSESFVFTTLKDNTTPNAPVLVSEIWSGADLTITWQPPTANADGSPLTDLKDYQLTLTANHISVVYHTVNSSFVYTGVQNAHDFGSLQPHIVVDLRAEDYTGHISEPATADVINAIPPDPTVAPILTLAFNGISVTMTAPAGLDDFKSYLLEHGSAVGGPFTQVAEVEDGDTYLHVSPGGGQHFYRYKYKDFFSQVSAGYSPVSGGSPNGGGSDSIYFHMSGDVFTSVDIVASKLILYPTTSLKVIGTLGQVGISTTEVTIYKNGESIGVLSIPATAGLTPVTTTIATSFDGAMDVVSAKVTIPGTNAKELGIEVVAIP